VQRDQIGEYRADRIWPIPGVLRHHNFSSNRAAIRAATFRQYDLN
jgi:hypothetical protein